MIYVADASRAVGVATTLLSKEMRGTFIEEQRAEYAKIRERLANKQPKAAKLSYLEAVKMALTLTGMPTYHLNQICLAKRSLASIRLKNWCHISIGLRFYLVELDRKISKNSN